MPVWRTNLKKAVRTVSESIDESLAARTKLINIITICRRAGKLEMGFDASVQSAEKHKAKLIFTAADVSPKTAKEAEFAAEKYNVPYMKLSVKMDDLYYGLSKRIGVAAVSDQGFADRIAQLEQNS